MTKYNSDGAAYIQQPVGGAAIEFRPMMRLVYMWMGLGLLVTSVVAVVAASTGFIISLLEQSPLLFFGLIFVQLILVVALNASFRRVSPTIAAILFFIYSAVTGLTFSIFFLAYDLGAIYSAFFTTAGLFGVMTVVGFTTKVDLSKFSTYFMMALIGLVIALVVNMFLRSSAFDLLISVVGVILFTGLTAWDTQKLKNLAATPGLNASSEHTMRLSIYGALVLYLDFINLFIFLLRIFGGSRK